MREEEKQPPSRPSRYTHGSAITGRPPPAPDWWGWPKGLAALIASLRFIWNATSGHRFRPWRSEYLKWRIETYSGMKAEELRLRDTAGFVWREKGNLLRFLRWIDRMDAWKKSGASRSQRIDS
jgi:hypothetical protein